MGFGYGFVTGDPIGAINSAVGSQGDHGGIKSLAMVFVPITGERQKDGIQVTLFGDKAIKTGVEFVLGY